METQDVQVDRDQLVLVGSVVIRGQRDLMEIKDLLETKEHLELMENQVIKAILVHLVW